MLISACLIANTARANGNTSLNLGVKLLGANWEGNNENSGTEFDTTEGGQLGINIAFQKGSFYAGISMQGGEYQFDNNAPDQVTSSGTQSFSNVKIRHRELDLIAGYFFWDRISLFLDIKGIGYKWDNNDHEQTFAGIGLGTSGFWPVSENWALYGSAGFVPSGDVEANGTKVGDGSSGALEFGAMFNINESNRLTFGLKSSAQTYKFDSGDKQKHKMNGVFVGYSYVILF